MLFSKLFALAALSAITPSIAAPAPASDAAATIATSKAADGEYCTETLSSYSADESIWASFRFCIRVSDTGAEFIGKVDKAKYYWGLAWLVRLTR
ncbi:hypothetical protein N7447_003581 [Penicillium robsamsonii]|uniref:uncharacterized protein n=1 Tax=Penicillium robsamsonii TaxID=1792511 RepID=UPI00254994F5|nr:uncharacterized protein N7447_003581 [Penicillium robsamsonii]KAJ5826818.1 hypothetical protein N7447_003581 [Penicillium robsamsonii]